MADTSSILERRARLLGPNMTTFYREPVHVVRGEGTWLWDADGKRYLDCYNNVPHVGHAHPKVVEAITKQASTLNTHTRYLHDGRARSLEEAILWHGGEGAPARARFEGLSRAERQELLAFLASL